MSTEDSFKTAAASLSVVKQDGLYNYICELWDIKEHERNRFGVRFSVFSTENERVFSSIAQFSEPGMKLPIRKLEEADDAERCEVSIEQLFYSRNSPRRELRYELVIEK